MTTNTQIYRNIKATFSQPTKVMLSPTCMASFMIYKHVILRELRSAIAANKRLFAGVDSEMRQITLSKQYNTRSSPSQSHKKQLAWSRITSIEVVFMTVDL